MTETQQRFLRAIAERVPREQVVEVHLFPPIRQGGVETGVAVVAEDPRPVASRADNPGSALEDAASSGDSASQVSAVLDGAVQARDAVELEVATAIAAEDNVMTDASVDESPYAEEDGAEIAPDESTAEAVAMHGPSADEAPADDPYADEVADEPEDEATEAANDVAAPRPRYTIHTARYRLTLKGVDRGKWDFDLVAEADAPLDAVDAVVRGVQRRAGEGADPDRLTAQAFGEALDAPVSQLDR